MIVTAHQPAYLPWLGYIHKIALSDIYVLLDDVQFEKNSFTNRNYIYSKQGNVMLTVPLYSKGHISKSIREIEINNTENWGIKHWKTIEQNYRKTPFFNKFAPWLESIYNKDWKYLIDLTDEMLNFYLKCMNITTRVVKQSELQVHSHKQDLVLDLCLATKANVYISGKLGRDYINLIPFESEKIYVYFQDYIHPKYNQIGKNEFTPFLGIIDLLFNVGSEEALSIILSGNVSKTELMKGKGYEFF
jgi:hypothetical protein